MPPRPVEEIRERLYEVAADPYRDVAEGALWIAAEEYPDLEIPRYDAYLDERASRIRAAVPANATADAWRSAMTAEIFEHERFAGNGDDYYDPRNSYLNDVIDRKLGIPITLAVIYLSVARRLGRDAAGLNTPGHFLVLDEGAVIDPFNGGRVVEHDVLQAQIEQAGAERPAEHLDRLLAHPADTRSILARMLVNLRTNHLRLRDTDRALADVDRLVHIDADNPAWLRDRGALFQRLDCHQAAASDLEAYLERAPEDPEADVIRQVIERLHRERPPLQ